MKIRANLDTLFLVAALLLAILLRLILLPHQSFDFTEFFGPWYGFIRENGGWQSLRSEFANYTPPYLYLLGITARLLPGLESVYAVKLFPLALDFVAAYIIYRIVHLGRPEGPAPWLAALAVLFTPTVFLNSAFWGQVDILYTTGLLVSLFFLATRRDTLAMIAFGVAISFKLQAAFLLPLLAVLVLTNHIAWKKLLWIPVVYFVMFLPAWIAGRPLSDLFEVYFEQSTTYQSLAMNAATLYQWLPNDLYDLFYPAGMVLAATVALLYIWMASKGSNLTEPAALVGLALVSAFIMPYFLPKMHDRYFFVADVLSIAFAFYYPRYFYVPILVIGASLFSYTPFLFGTEVIPLRYLAIVQLVTAVILFRWLASRIHYPESVERQESGHFE